MEFGNLLVGEVHNVVPYLPALSVMSTTVYERGRIQRHHRFFFELANGSVEVASVLGGIVLAPRNDPASAF